jgi:hypothetical protein
LPLFKPLNSLRKLFEPKPVRSTPCSSSLAVCRGVFEQWSWQVKGVQAMADGLKDLPLRFGFGFGFEKHMVYIRDTVKATARLVKDRLHCVHLKNSASLRGAFGPLATALGEGEINNRQFLRRLLGIGYKGAICVEAPRGGDRDMSGS